jgi:hypothetical protein
MATLGTASDSVRLLRSLALAPRGSRLEAAYFVVTRERKNVSARSSSGRRRAIRVGLLRSLALAPTRASQPVTNHPDFAVVLLHPTSFSHGVSPLVIIAGDRF